MADNVSKICADHLRECYPGLKSSHAHEVVAAFFGYKSHAALLADKRYAADDVDLAAILIPDEFIVADRLRDLKGLPEKLPQAGCLVDTLVRLLLGDGIFEGEVWDCFDVGEYVMEDYLPANLNENLEFELEEIIASTNAIFEEISYDECHVVEADSGVTVTVLGTYQGYWLEDKDDDEEAPEIELVVTVYLRRCAGRISFEEPEVGVVGTLREKIAANIR
jgi:hypothetical protein